MKLLAYYKKLHWTEKVLDISLLVGIVVGIILFIGTIFFSPGPEFIRFSHSFDIVIIGLLVLDMSRHFLRSRNFLDFFKHYWLDLVILVIVSVFFSTVLFIGTGRIAWLIREERMLIGVSRFLRLNFLGKIFK